MTSALNGGPGTRLDLDTLLPYLDLHLAGATNGVRLFNAARISWAGTPYEAEFTRMRKEISEERTYLKKLIRTLGHRPSRIKMGFAHVASVVAEFDPLNPLRRKATAGAQLELEALQSLLRGKEALWLTLLALPAGATAGHGRPGFDRAALERLLTASREQQDAVSHVMTETAPGRFLVC